MIAYGGGLDYRLDKRMRLRVFDFEYEQWRVSPRALLFPTALAPASASTSSDVILCAVAGETGECRSPNEGLRSARRYALPVLPGARPRPTAVRGLEKAPGRHPAEASESEMTVLKPRSRMISVQLCEEGVPRPSSPVRGDRSAQRVRPDTRCHALGSAKREPGWFFSVFTWMSFAIK